MTNVQKVVLITGMQAAGKSTIAPLLASRLGPPAATVDGDVYYHAVVAGAAGMTPDPSPEALRQLQLRYDASALVACHYLEAGFDFVCSDIILGDHVTRWLDSFKGIADPYLVVLNPSIDSIVQREIARGSNSYRDWQGPGRTLADAVATLQEGLKETPQRGLWLNTTGQTAEESTDAILEQLERARW
ncbi:AAA family ATPase [Kribbella sp. NPDC006257]|uniref:AAA family ATPase n=1 Tax=Kribbella sp. NPDC006257 TaxID=3156738 RepID=UPI0033B258E6